MKKTTKKLLTEGGVAGHLMHLYDNPGLTASEMVDILTAANDGQLTGTEKTDGFNIFLGYNNGEAKYARNKGDMRAGGRTGSELAAREFAGGDKIRDVYLQSFAAFATAVESLDPESQAALFGEQGQLFLNTEIQGPGASNLVNYDANILSIHSVGHKYYDAKSDTVENADNNTVTRIASTLDASLDRFEEATSEHPFSVRRTAVLTLQGIEDNTFLEEVLYRIAQAGFTGSMTMEQYINNKIGPIVKRGIPSADKELISLIIQHIKQVKGRKNLRLVRKMLGSPEEGESLTDLLSQKAQLLKDAVAPIEDAIHDFAVELLKGVESAYILNNSVEMERVRGEVHDAIEKIQRYDGPGSDEAQDILIRQLKKIKSHENINSAVEGFVFDWDGFTYKFTGNFAPANQILGLFKYGRGAAPPIRVDEEVSADAAAPEDNSEGAGTGRKVAVVPGGFKPPHRGHFAMVQAYANVADKVIVFVSPLSRPTPSGIDITSEDSISLWNEYVNAYGLSDKVEIKVSTVNSPVRLVFDFVANGWDAKKEKQVSEPNPDYAQAGDQVILGVSTKGGDDSRFTASAQQYAHPRVRVAAGKEWAVKVAGDDFVHSLTGDPLSASAMREAEASAEAFAEFLPTKLRNKASQIFNNLFNKQVVANEGLERLIEKMLLEGGIDEMSAMGAGAVEGPGAGAGSQNKDEEEGYPLGAKKRSHKQDTIIREDDEEELSEQGGDEYTHNGRMPSLINQIDYVERGPAYEGEAWSDSIEGFPDGPKLQTPIEPENGMIGDPTVDDDLFKKIISSLIVTA